MEIQKIFSEDNGEERLYSVLLDETEIELFSEFQKEFNSKAQKALRKAWDIKNANKVKEAFDNVPQYFEKNKVRIGRVNNPFKSLGGINSVTGSAGGNTLNSRINTKGLIEEGLTPVDKSDRAFKNIAKNRGGITGETDFLGGVSSGNREISQRRKSKINPFVGDSKYLNRKKN